MQHGRTAFHALEEVGSKENYNFHIFHIASHFTQFQGFPIYSFQ